jgi:hypothetical protein
MLQAHGVGQRGCLVFLAGCYLLGAIFISFVRVPTIAVDRGPYG